MIQRWLWIGHCVSFVHTGGQTEPYDYDTDDKYEPGSQSHWSNPGPDDTEWKSVVFLSRVSGRIDNAKHLQRSCVKIKSPISNADENEQS